MYTFQSQRYQIIPDPQQSIFYALRRGSSQDSLEHISSRVCPRECLQNERAYQIPVVERDIGGVKDLVESFEGIGILN